MESPSVSGLRSRSRSKTPFLRSSCDHESCTEVEEHSHKSGRKTPVKRQLGQPSKITTEVITETVEQYTSPASRTRHSTRSAGEKLVKTSDYSSEESLDRVRGHRKEIFQNEINSQYERVSSNSHSYTALDDVTLSPIQASYNVTQDRSTRFGSPAYSACSTDSSFAEQALADTSLLLAREPTSEHLPSRLYKMAGEYWNKYPKTDYTYSKLSKDRVELAPGQIAMPNMSRRSLSQFRIQGPNTSADELDHLGVTNTWTTSNSTSSLRKRYTSVESSDDETAYTHKAAPYDERWWITRLLVTIISSITTSTRNTYRKIVGPPHRYPYTDRRPVQASIASQTAAVAAAPFVWMYTVIKSAVTTTVTTVTETFSPNHVENDKYIARTALKKAEKRRWWPWLLLLLLPALGYGSHYTYENWEHLAMPNFTDFQLDLTEFRSKLPDMPTFTLADLNILPKINLTMPDINITLPDISDNLPEVKRTYHEYKDIVQNRMTDASDYMKVVAESCFEEMRRFWGGVIG